MRVSSRRLSTRNHANQTLVNRQFEIKFTLRLTKQNKLFVKIPISGTQRRINSYAIEGHQAYNLASYSVLRVFKYVHISSLLRRFLFSVDNHNYGEFSIYS